MTAASQINHPRDDQLGEEFSYTARNPLPAYISAQVTHTSSSAQLPDQYRFPQLMTLSDPQSCL